MTSHRQVSFMPWADQKEIRIGNVIFWPYEPNTITDKVIKKHFNKLFKCYVDISGDPVDTITVASFKDKNYFEPLTPDEQSEMKEARDILCFICIASQTRISVGMNNNSIVPISAELFQLVSQNFVPGVYDFAYRSGNLLSGGWTLDDIHFSKPLSTGGVFKGGDGNLYKGFSELLKRPADDADRVRILRTLEWFRLAHVESDEITLFSKIVMISTAFEVLLAFPPNAKSEYFQETIDQIFPSNTFKSEQRPYRKGSRTASLAGWWAWDFYKLRNSIVHGDVVNPNSLVYTSWLTHLIVANLVLLKLIKIELEQFGFINEADSYTDIYQLLGWLQ